MRRAMRCHDFRLGQEVRRSQYREYWLGARRRDGRKFVPALRVAAKIAARRSVEEGSAQRGAGTRLRDATVEPIAGASLRMPIHARLRGQIPIRGPSCALRCARLRGSDRVGVCRPVHYRRAHPVSGSHPIAARSEPAPPCTGHVVGRLDRIVDTLCGVLLVIHNFGSQRTRVSLC